MSATIQILNGPDFIDQITQRIREESFIQAMEVNGLCDLLIDKYAVQQLLNKSSGTTINRYVELGREDTYGNRHFLKRVYKDNAPKFRLIDVLEFKKACL